MHLHTIPWVRSFLLDFEYSKKFQFSLCVAFFCALFIGSLLLRSEHDLTSRYPLQIFGLKYFQELNILLQKIIENEFSSKITNQINLADHSPLQSQIDESLFIIGKNNTLLESRFFSHSDPIMEDLNFYYSQLLLDWSEIKKIPFNKDDNQKSLLHYKLIENVNLIINKAKEAFQLTQNFDSGTSRLLNIYANKLPTMRFIISRVLFDTQIIDNKDDLTVQNAVDIAALKLNLQSSREYVFQNLQEAQNELGLDGPTFDLNRNEQTLLNDLILATADFSRQIDLEVLQTPEGNREFSQIIKTGKQSLNIILNLMSEIASELDAILSTQLHVLRKRKYFGFGFILFGTFLGLLFYLTRVIRRPLADLKTAIEELGKGNLSARVPITSRDEVADMCIAFNAMATFFEKIMIDAKRLATNLADSTSNIYATRELLETNLASQEKAICQISNNTKGMGKTVQDFILALQEVSNAAALTAHLTKLGNQSFDDMENTIHHMSSTSKNIVAILSLLQHKLISINNVIGKIITIADQINLLSLNTAIRADKKDLKNLGFSIIANQISELSDETAAVTLDFEESMRNIVSAVDISYKEVEEFSSQIKSQLSDAQEIQKALKQLVELTQTQIASFETINRGMQQQAKRAHTIHESICLLSGASKKTSQSIRYLYLEIEYLHHASHNLQMMTKNYTKNTKNSPLEDLKIHQASVE